MSDYEGKAKAERAERDESFRRHKEEIYLGESGGGAGKGCVVLLFVIGVAACAVSYGFYHFLA